MAREAIGGIETGRTLTISRRRCGGGLSLCCRWQVAALILSIMFPLAYDENEALLRFQESSNDPAGLSIQHWSTCTPLKRVPNKSLFCAKRGEKFKIFNF